MAFQLTATAVIIRSEVNPNSQSDRPSSPRLNWISAPPRASPNQKAPVETANSTLPAGNFATSTPLRANVSSTAASARKRLAACWASGLSGQASAIASAPALGRKMAT